MEEAETSGGFEASFLLWVLSDWAEGFILLVEAPAKAAAFSGRTSLSFVVRKDEESGSSKSVGESGRSAFIGYNYFLGWECVALDGPDPDTFVFLMKLLGYGVSVTRSEKSANVKLSW